MNFSPRTQDYYWRYQAQSGAGSRASITTFSGPSPDPSFGSGPVPPDVSADAAWLAEALREARQASVWTKASTIAIVAVSVLAVGGAIFEATRRARRGRAYARSTPLPP